MYLISYLAISLLYFVDILQILNRLTILTLTMALSTIVYYNISLLNTNKTK